MIQRIQTLFLFVAFLAAIAAFFFPIANFFSDEYSIQFSIYGIEKFTEYSNEVSINTVPLIALISILGLLSFIIIFLFKNRILQLRMIRFAILIDIVYLVLVFFFYVPKIEEVTNASAEYLTIAGIYFPLVALVFLILASRYILKDEKIVRSADRLR